MKSITFLTRHYPPSLNINGESVCDLVEYIQTHHQEVECNIIHIDKHLDTGGKQRSPVGNLFKIKNYLDYNNPICKGLKMLLDGYLLVRKAKKIKNTFYVITTSPPLLPFWAGLMLGKKRKRSLWALDLFPESFMAKGAISKSNFIYQWILKKTYSVSPEYIIALGNNQAKFLAEDCFKKDDIKTLLLPCGFFEDKVPEGYPKWYESDKIMLGYCGSIHDAHNPEFVINMIDSIDPKKHKLVLALYGDKAPAVREYAKGKPGIYLTKSLPRYELTFIDVHMVSLLPKFTHLAVPSKAISAITMERTILFCGDEQCDSWAMLRKAAWYIPEDSEMKKNIETFCKTITKEEIQEKKKHAILLAKELKEVVLESYNAVAKHAISNKI